MKVYLLTIILCSLFLTPLMGVEKNLYPPMTSHERLRFEKEINKSLIMAKKRMDDQFVRLGKSKKILTAADKMEFEAAKTSYYAKTLLANELMQSEPIERSSLIRDHMLTLMKKEHITEIDLLTFQSEISQVKTLIRENDLLL